MNTILMTLTANLSPKLRREQLQGRNYYVAPVTLIVPGVLDGSNGPLYYPSNEIATNADAWNNMPIVVYHPTVGGKRVSARNPAILDVSAIGLVLNVRVVDEKLVGEGWFEIDRTRKIDDRVLRSLEKGQPIELSTGLFTEDKAAPEGSNFKGVSYSFTARNYRPDHLAILPDMKGACSIQDGCGVFNKGNDTSNNTGENVMDEKEKKALVDFIITNSCCYKEADREEIMTLNDDQITKYHTELKTAKDTAKTQEAVHNAAVKGFKDPGGNDHTWNEEKKEWETKVAKEPVVNTKTESTKRVEPETTEEWMAKAPLEVRMAVTNSVRIVERSKAEIIERLVANAADDEKKETLRASLGQRTLADLEGYQDMLPKTEETKPVLNFAGVGPTANVTNQKQMASIPFPGETLL